MRGNESFREQAGLGEILGRQDAALLLDGGHLAPDLIQVHRRDRVELGLELAEAGEKTGRAHIRRPRRQTGAHTTVSFALPARVEFGDACEAGVGEGRP